jgi:acyl-CoA dehydrogenase
LNFDNCRIAADAMIGGPGDGFKVAMATLDVFRTTVAAAALGFARRALDEALRHTSTRQLFGAPLSALQMTESAIADMATEIDASAGGLGVTKGNIAESLYREIRALRIYEGASEVQKVIIARQTYSGSDK